METEDEGSRNELVSRELVAQVERQLNDRGLVAAAQLLAQNEPVLYEMIYKWGLGSQLAIAIPQTKELACAHVRDCTIFASVIVAEIFQRILKNTIANSGEEVDRHTAVWLPNGHPQAWPPSRRQS